MVRAGVPGLVSLHKDSTLRKKKKLSNWAKPSAPLWPIDKVRFGGLCAARASGGVVAGKWLTKSLQTEGSRGAVESADNLESTCIH